MRRRIVAIGLMFWLAGSPLTGTVQALAGPDGPDSCPAHGHDCRCHKKAVHSRSCHETASDASAPSTFRCGCRSSDSQEHALAPLKQGELPLLTEIECVTRAFLPAVPILAYFEAHLFVLDPPPRILSPNPQT